MPLRRLLALLLALLLLPPASAATGTPQDAQPEREHEDAWRPFFQHGLPPAPGAEALRAPLVHALGRTGADIKVAVIDFGFDAEHPAIAHRVVETRSFDDKPVDEGDLAHGTACAEILLGVAPDAQLHLLRARTQSQIVEALDWSVANGIRVVSMSLGSYAGPFDGTSAVAQAVTRASDAGVLVAVSAGNSARHHWSGAWQDADGDGRLEFAPGVESLTLTMRAGQGTSVHLSWDAHGGPHDHDLFLLDASGRTLASSRHPQPGAPPIEVLEYESPTAQQVRIEVRRAGAEGAPRFHLFVDHMGPALDAHAVAAGSVGTPADARGAIVVGAVDPDAPYALHPYSSQGPAADGQMVPHVVAPAGIAVSAYGSTGFYGTSASTPHVAGLLALMVQERPGLTREAALELLAQAAQDLDEPGPDSRTGHGWVDAFELLRRTDTTPPGILDASLGVGARLRAGTHDITLHIDDSLDLSKPPTATLETVDARTHSWPIQLVDGRLVRVGGEVPWSAPPGLAILRLDGLHDWAGNLAGNATHRLVVDTVGPTLLPLAPLPGSETTMRHPQLRVQLSDPHSGVDAESLRLRLDGRELPFELRRGMLVAVDTQPLAPGPHLVQLSARDALGNDAYLQWRFLVAPPEPEPAPPLPTGPLPGWADASRTPLRGDAGPAWRVAPTGEALAWEPAQPYAGGQPYAPDLALVPSLARARNSTWAGLPSALGRLRRADTENTEGAQRAQGDAHVSVITVQSL